MQKIHKGAAIKIYDSHWFKILNAILRFDLVTGSP